MNRLTFSLITLDIMIQSRRIVNFTPGIHNFRDKTRSKFDSHDVFSKLMANNLIHY